MTSPQEIAYEVASSWGTWTWPNAKSAKLSALRHSKKFEIGGGLVTVRNTATGEIVARYRNGQVDVEEGATT